MELRPGDRFEVNSIVPGAFYDNMDPCVGDEGYVLYIDDQVEGWATVILDKHKNLKMYDASISIPVENCDVLAPRPSSALGNSRRFEGYQPRSPVGPKPDPYGVGSRGRLTWGAAGRSWAAVPDGRFGKVVV